MTNQSNEEREGQESIDRVLRVFQIIWSNWERTNRYSYEIFSREKVVGRHLNDIRNVKHWVGAGGKGEELNLNELVAVFRLIGSQYEQVGFIKHHAKPSVRSTVNLRPTDAEIITTLRQLRVAEPVDESDDK